MQKVPAAVIVALLVCTPVQAVIAVTYLDDHGERPCSLEAEVLDVGEYDTIMIGTTVKDMYDAGYTIGDRVEVTARNGSYSTTFVNNYNGIGVMDGYISIPTEVGNEHMMVGFFNIDAWDLLGAEIGDKMGLAYNGHDPVFSKIPCYVAGDKGTYDHTQTPEEYSNFRAVSGPGLKENVFYRSCSPWREGLERTEMTADLYEEYGIEYNISLGDTGRNVEGCRGLYGDGYYPLTLYDSGNSFVDQLEPDANVKPQDLRKAMKALIDSDGKTVINCYLGKDRTGLVVSMMLALTGSSYEEVKHEYMLSYVNHYRVEEGSEEYKVLGNIMFDRYFYLLGHLDIVEIHGDFDWSVLDDYVFDLKAISIDFLTNQAGMTEDEMERLMERISK